MNTTPAAPTPADGSHFWRPDLVCWTGHKYDLKLLYPPDPYVIEQELTQFHLLIPEEDAWEEIAPDAELVRLEMIRGITEWFLRQELPFSVLAQVVQSLLDPVFEPRNWSEGTLSHLQPLVDGSGLLTYVLTALSPLISTEAGAQLVYHALKNFQLTFDESTAPLDGTAAAAALCVERNVHHAVRLVVDGPRWLCYVKGAWMTMVNDEIAAGQLSNWLHAQIAEIDRQLATTDETRQVAKTYNEQHKLRQSSRSVKIKDSATTAMDVLRSTTTGQVVADIVDQRAVLEQYGRDIKIATTLLRQLATYDHLWISADEMAGQPHQFVTPTHMVDLRTGTAAPLTPLHVTLKHSRARYDRQAQCPTWKAFVARAFPDPAVQEYVQRALGYSITGDTRAKCAFAVIGTSDVGKSTITNVPSLVLGEYAREMPEGGLFVGGANRHSAELALLHGVRMSVASEVTADDVIDAGRFKRVTGNGDPVTARLLYQNFVTFRPMVKVWFTGNDMPQITETSSAIARRIFPISMTVVIPPDEQIVDFETRVAREEGAGILNWLIEGARKWYADGGNQAALKAPDSIFAERQLLLEDADPYYTFFEFWITTSNGIGREDYSTSTTLYEAFTLWTKENGVRIPPTQNAFGRLLTSRGFRKKRSPNGFLYAATLKEPAIAAAIAAGQRQLSFGP